MQSRATNVKQYLSELPADRRAAIEAVRKTIQANLDKAYEEGMQYGMIGYFVPHKVYPNGYHCDPNQPLPFAGLASQKNHMSLYLMSAYGEGPEEGWFRAQWAKTGKKLDMGKCCIRFKKLDDLALDVIGEAIRRVPAADYVARYEAFLKSYGIKHKGAAPAKSAPKTKSAARTKKGAAAAKSVHSKSSKANKRKVKA
jgi:hypothetical protein